MQKLPFKESQTRSSNALELVHSDVFTLRTPSFTGLRHMVTFIDDYSRYTWVYFLKEKSEVFEKVSSSCMLQICLSEKLDA